MLKISVWCWALDACRRTARKLSAVAQFRLGAACAPQEKSRRRVVREAICQVSGDDVNSCGWCPQRLDQRRTRFVSARRARWRWPIFVTPQGFRPGLWRLDTRWRHVIPHGCPVWLRTCGSRRKSAPASGDSPNRPGRASPARPNCGQSPCLQ